VTADLVRPPHGGFVVAWLDGDPVGCGAVKPLFDLDTHERIEGVGEIKRMYTAPRARRRGISRMVLARLEDIAGGLGYRRLVLETGTAQPEAVELYASAGWSRVTPYGRYRASPWSVCFAKDLAS
jgi:GNAT superfamily N-acetyltransferase